MVILYVLKYFVIKISYINLKNKEWFILIVKLVVFEWNNEVCVALLPLLVSALLSY